MPSRVDFTLGKSCSKDATRRLDESGYATYKYYDISFYSPLFVGISIHLRTLSVVRLRSFILWLSRNKSVKVLFLNIN